jgi:hypothetical protein
MDEENLVAVRAAIVATAVSRILAGFGMTGTADKVDGAALAWCLESKLYTVAQGASLAYFDGVNSRMRQGNMCGMPSVDENTKPLPDRIVRKTRFKKEAPAQLVGTVYRAAETVQNQTASQHWFDP